MASNQVNKHYATSDEFYMDLKATLMVYHDSIPKKDLLHLEARSSIVLLEKIIEDNDLFSYIKDKTEPVPPKPSPLGAVRKPVKKLDDSSNSVREPIIGSEESDPESDYEMGGKKA